MKIENIYEKLCLISCKINKKSENNIDYTDDYKRLAHFYLDNIRDRKVEYVLRYEYPLVSNLFDGLKEELKDYRRPMGKRRNRSGKTI